MIAWPMWTISAAWSPKQWMPRICRVSRWKSSLSMPTVYAGDLGAGEAAKQGVADLVGDLRR
jgi:hypothetical protein